MHPHEPLSLAFSAAAAATSTTTSTTCSSSSSSAVGPRSPPLSALSTVLEFHPHTTTTTTTMPTRSRSSSVSSGGGESAASSTSSSAATSPRHHQHHQRHPHWYSRKQHAKYKTEMCRTFAQTGKCRFGSNCSFAHDIAELRAPSLPSSFKTRPCNFFWTLGYCPFGDRCYFCHNATSEGDKVITEDAFLLHRATSGRLPVFAALAADKDDDDGSTSVDLDCNHTSPVLSPAPPAAPFTPLAFQLEHTAAAAKTLVDDRDVEQQVVLSPLMTVTEQDEQSTAKLVREALLRRQAQLNRRHSPQHGNKKITSANANTAAGIRRSSAPVTPAHVVVAPTPTTREYRYA